VALQDFHVGLRKGTVNTRTRIWAQLTKAGQRAFKAHVRGSTLEEKENRVTEMILTTLKPTTLISGKVLALFGIELVQMLIFSSPVVIGYLFFREQINIPDFDLSELVFEPAPLITGFLILVGGFALFTNTLVAIGAVMPTVKEAGNYMAVMIALIFVPFYAVALIFSTPRPSSCRSSRTSRSPPPSLRSCATDWAR
jgi:hypothetical protein